MKDDSEIYAGLLSSNGAPVPLEGVKVYGDIIGRGAKVKICQHFRNIEQNPIEAVYKFPLPESAAICGFRAIVGDKVIEGEIEERDEAFNRYDKALAEGHGAQLLDEERPNIFTLSVGNIKPGDCIVIEISYIELMDSHKSEVRFFLPTTISPRYTQVSQPDENGIPIKDLVNPPLLFKVPYGLNININIHDKEGISSIESPSHNVNTKLTDNKAIVSFSTEEAVMDRDFILNVAYEKESASKGYLYKDQNGTFIQVDFTADADGEIYKDKCSGNDREMIFVLDCSGSMDGESIEEAKKALKIAVNALRPGIMFNIYLFGSSFKSLYSHSKAYDETTLNEALKRLSEASASLGGTEVLGPLKNIYSQKLKEGCHRDIILITDGQISNEDEVMGLVKRHADKTNVYTIGIGSGPNEFFIRGVARASGGTSEMVAPREKIEPKILRLFRNALAGRIRNLEIGWNAEVKQAPENPVLFQGQHCSVFAQLKDAAHEVKSLKISGQTMSGVKVWGINIEPVTVENLPVSKLWARERIRDLEEGPIRSRGSKQKDRTNARSVDEIIEISKKYGIISSKTSFVGVDKRPDSDKSCSEIDLRKVPATLTTGWGGVQKTHHMPMAAHTRYGSIRPMSIMNQSEMSYSFLESSADLEIPTFLRKQDDPLMAILSLQRNDGGFDVGKLLEVYLHLSLSDIRRIADEIEGNARKLRKQLEHSRGMLISFKNNAAMDVNRWKEMLTKVHLELSDKGTNKKTDIIERDIWQFAEAIEMKIDELTYKIIKHIEDLVTEIEGRFRNIDPMGIVVTIVVFLLLETKFDDRRSEWEGQVHNSRYWLEDQLQRSMLIVNRQKFEYEIRELIRAGLKAG
jgi:Ca-activated chloride channel family protein